MPAEKPAEKKPTPALPVPAGVNGLEVSLTGLPSNQPWAAELIPLEKLKLFREERAWQFAQPDLIPVDLSKEAGKTGLLLSYRRTDKEGSQSLSLPLVDGKEAMGESQEGFSAVFTVTKNTTGVRQGYMLMGSGTMRFIWVIKSGETALPLTFRGEGTDAAMKGTLKISPATAP